MSGLCLLTATGIAVMLGSGDIRLEWLHSVERTRWTEHWQIEDGRLRLAEASVEGSGAGMDPPPHARLHEGRWRWRPDLPLLDQVTLRRSGATADWQICTGGRCRSLSDLVGNADPIVLKPC